MLNLDTTRPLLKQAKPLLDSLSAVRPLIMLPFNIWLYFVTLPFRVLFFLTSLNGSTRKEKVEEVKEKVMEIKEEVVQALPEQLTMRKPAPIEQRPLKQSIDNDRRPFGWYQTEKEQPERQPKEEKKATKTAEPEKPFLIDPIAQLKTQLTETTAKSVASAQENVRLNQELSELKAKFDSDEKALKTKNVEEERLRQLVNIEQRKIFDLKQETVSLKQRIEKLEEEKAASLTRTAEEKPAEKPVEKPAKLGAKKSKKSRTVEPAVKPIEKTEAELEREDPLNHPHGWKKAGGDIASHFTEMVAKAQQEEREHGQTFAEVLKESTKPASAPVKTEAEFLVVGGDHSMHHETLPISAK